MAYCYVPVDRDQLFLLPSSLRDWLPEGHLAWFVVDVVGKVDTSAFHARHANDGVGRPAYDPDMMLALLIYAYCTKVRASRRIEQLCESDVAYRVICANRVPDHGTIARFVVDHETAIKGLFVDVLVLCAAAGLTTLGSIAIDGTKMGADAALDANRSAAAVRAEVERIMAEARGIDAADDARLGSARGDELPAELASPLSRLARLERALAELAELEAAAEAEAEAGAALKAQRAAAAAAQGRKPMGRPPVDPHEALARAEANLTAVKARAAAKAARWASQAAGAATQGRKMRGPKPGGGQAVARAEQCLAEARAAADSAVGAAPAQVNVTDPDSRIMKTPGGWVQGYNAQAAVNDAQVVLACEVTQDANDVRRLVPMMQATAETVAAAGITSPIGMVLADAGYWSDHNASAPGPDRLIATLKDWKQRQAARRLGVTTGPPPAQATPIEAMEHRLRTPEGTAAYARRSCTVEPVFANHKENRGFRRFMRRGLDAVTSEWSFINTTHNLLKLYRTCPQLT